MKRTCANIYELFTQASPDTRQSVNSATSHDTTVTEVTDPDTQSLKAVVSVCWETREGSAKAGRDFQYSIGKLVCHCLLFTIIYL